MKATAEHIEQEPVFKPIKVSFVLESKDDLLAMYSVLAETTANNLIDAIESTLRSRVDIDSIIEFQDVAYTALGEYYQRYFDE